MRTSNPVFARFPETMKRNDAPATFFGILNKTAVGLLSVFAIAFISYVLIPVEFLKPVLIGSLVTGLIVSFVVFRMASMTPLAVFTFTLFEGVFVGTFSKIMEMLYPGLVVQAILATFLVAGALLLFYRSSNFRVTPKVRKMIFGATAALGALYLVNLGLSLFGVNLGIVEVGGNAGMLSIVISIVAVSLAAFNLVVDFDQARDLVENGAPEYEEWRAALGMVVTLVWLYVELLRILSYFRR